jgi:uncharacterized protein (DUF362 family)
MLKRFVVERYDRSALYTSFTHWFKTYGWLELLRARGTSVLLKPNFVMPSAPHDPSTTHPDFYMSIAHVLKDAGFDVGIGESPAFGSCEAALRRHGVLEECKHHGIDVVEFRGSRTVVGVEHDEAYTTLTIARELSAWSSLINLPKLKTHKQLVFTGATKNLYGCVTGKRKFFRHNLCKNDPVRFARMIIANARAANAVLHIADGIEAAHVTGPRGGVPYALRTVLVGDEPLALDWAFCLATGLQPGTTPLFQALESQAREQAAAAARAVLHGIEPETDFVHAKLIHVSFGPIAVLRSFARSVRQRYGCA